MEQPQVLAQPGLAHPHEPTQPHDEQAQAEQAQQQQQAQPSLLPPLLPAVGAERLSSLALLPDYVSAAEEAALLRQVHAAPRSKWVQVRGRRLQQHGGTVHAKGLIPAPLPAWLEALTARLHADLPGAFPAGGPNHVLINAYSPGCGIMPHEDGPLYHLFVCILSLGCPAVLRFWRKQAEGGTGGLPPVASVLVPPRSLLAFSGDAYTHCLHGIEEVSEEVLDSSVVNPGAAAGLKACCACGAAAEGCPQEPCKLPRSGERVSLTIRRVIKVNKALGGLLRR